LCVWLCGIGLDISPEPHHEIIDGPRIGIFVESPNILENGFARNGATLAANQMAEQFRFHQRHLDRAVTCANLQVCKIDRLTIE
jgi:hypothetical protein